MIAFCKQAFLGRKGLLDGNSSDVFEYWMVSESQKEGDMIQSTYAMIAFLLFLLLVEMVRANGYTYLRDYGKQLGDEFEKSYNSIPVEQRPFKDSLSNDF